MIEAPLTEISNDRLYAEVRANIAFEKMVVAVLISSLISGAVLLAVNSAVLIAKGGWRLADALVTTLGAMQSAFFIFLFGFAAAIVVGAPLFKALEKVRYRRVWPYGVAAVAVQYVGAAVWIGRPPTLETPAGLLFFAPGLFAAYLFGRFIRPIWLASARTSLTVVRSAAGDRH